MIWFMFALGQLAHLAAQVDTVARAKNTPVTSRKQIVLERLTPILVRVFICSLVFGIIVGGGVAGLYGLFGKEAPQWLIGISGLLANTSIVGYCIAGALGFGLDSALGYVPFLKAYIPPPIDQETAVSQKGFEQGVDATKAAVEAVNVQQPSIGS